MITVMRKNTHRKVIKYNRRNIMKFRLTFKTPDVTFNALENVDEDKQEEVKELIEKYVKYDEYLTVEFDTEDKTCVPVPVN